MYRSRYSLTPSNFSTVGDVAARMEIFFFFHRTRSSPSIEKSSSPSNPSDTLSGKSTANSSKDLALKFRSAVMERPVYSIPFFSFGRVLIALDGNNRPKRALPNPFVSLLYVISIGLTVTTTTNKSVRLLSKILTDRLSTSALPLDTHARRIVVDSTDTSMIIHSNDMATRRFDLRTRFRIRDAEISLTVERLLFDFRISPCRNRVHETTRPAVDAILRRFSRVTRPLTFATRMVPILARSLARDRRC